MNSIAADPLPSWNDGRSKQAVLAFVARVTKEGSPDFLPPADRIAVYDNDGTLWPENPMPFQAAFAIDELNRHILTEPKLASDPMVQAALAGDTAKLLTGEHFDGLMQILALTHAGMTIDEFRDAVEAWFRSARHPRYGRPTRAEGQGEELDPDGARKGLLRLGPAVRAAGALLRADLETRRHRESLKVDSESR